MEHHPNPSISPLWESAMRDPEYDRVRSLTDEEIIAECAQSRVQVVRELANRYDVAVEKLEEVSDAQPS